MDDPHYDEYLLEQVRQERDAALARAAGLERAILLEGRNRQTGEHIYTWCRICQVMVWDRDNGVHLHAYACAAAPLFAQQRGPRAVGPALRPALSASTMSEEDRCSRCGGEYDEECDYCMERNDDAETCTCPVWREEDGA